MLLSLILAVFFYLGGYRLDSIRPDVIVPNYLRKTVKPPRPIFLICASPKSKKHPLGVMVAGGVAAQLLGIGFAIYALAFFANPEIMGPIGMIQIVIQVFSLIMVLAAAYTIPYWLSQKYPYNE